MVPRRLERIFFKATNVTVLFGMLKMPECYLVVWKELFEVTNVTVLRGNLKMPECFLVVRRGVSRQQMLPSCMVS